MSKMSGGISQVVAAILKLWFCNDSFDCMKAGLVIKDPRGQHYRVYFNLAMILQDGGARKLVFHIKGDDGTELCVLCKKPTCVRNR